MGGPSHSGDQAGLAWATLAGILGHIHPSLYPFSQEGSSMVTVGTQSLGLAPDDSLLVPAGTQ